MAVLGNNRDRSRTAGPGGGIRAGLLNTPAGMKANFAQATPDSYAPFTYAGPTNATYADSNGNLAYSNGTTPRAEYYGAVPAGFKREGFAQNYCTNYNANPTLAGLTASGIATAGGVSIVADPANYLTTAINEYGKTVNLKANVCTAGNLIKVDNSLGTGVATLDFAGPAGTTSGIFSGSLYVLSPTGSALSLGATTATVSFASPTVLTRVKLLNFTPADTTSTLRLTVPAGGIAYCILNQLEANTLASSVIVTQGATASRTQDQFYISGLDTQPTLFNQTAAAMLIGLDYDDINNTPMYSFSVQNGTTSANWNSNNFSQQLRGTRSRIFCTSKIGGTAPQKQVGNNIGATTVDLGSIDKPNAPFFAGFNFNVAQTRFTLINGAFDQSIFNFGAGAATAVFNRLDIGGRVNNGANQMFGHIRSITMYGGPVSIPAMGGDVDMSNWQLALKDGQSNSIYAAGADAGNSGTQNGFNDGEKASIAILDQYFPTKRNAWAKAAEGGASYCFGAAQSTPNSFFQTSDSSFQANYLREADMIQACNNAGAIWLYGDDNQGETDTTATPAQQQQGFIALWNARRALIGTKTYTGGTLPILKEMIGRREVTSNSNAQYQYERENQKAYAAGLVPGITGIYNTPEGLIEPMGGNAVHKTNAGYQDEEPRITRKGLSVIGVNVGGPVDPPAIATASLSVSTITGTFSFPTGITALSPTSGGGTTNGPFRFFDQAGAPAPQNAPSGSEIQISTWSISGSNFTINLASAPTTAGLLYAGYGEMLVGSTLFDTTTWPRGNDAFSIPLQTATMPLPYTAYVPPVVTGTNTTWSDNSQVTWGDGTTTNWSA